MTEPRIVTPEEAQGRREIDYDREEWDLIHTVATEPDRIRAAVVKALTHLAQNDRDNGRSAWLIGKADAIENGADW